MFGFIKRWVQRQKDRDRSIDVRLDGIAFNMDACRYIIADDGKDKVVNRHLSKRIVELDRQAARCHRIADRLEGKQ